MRLSMTGRAGVGPAVGAALALVVLALCTTGWLAFERGLFQDDAQVLFEMHHLDGDLLRQATAPLASSTRRLQGLPYALALRTKDPLAAVQLWTEVLPFLVALTALVLARQAAHLPAAWAFMAAALTITASSDWLTASPVAIGYHLAILLHACGAIGLTLWSRQASRPALAIGLVAGTASLWTIDAATTIYPLTPLLAYLAATDDAGHRRARAAAAWWLVLAVPYYALFVAFLFDDSGYAGVALLDRPWWHRAARLTLLVLNNVAPWRWSTARGEWFGPTPLPPLGPTLVAMTCGVGATALAFRTLARAASACEPRRVRWGVAAVFAGFAVLANATYMSVQGAYLYYRTNLHSRLWTSLALAVALAALSRRGPRQARAAAGIAAIFVAGGIAGGVERQSYFRDAWTRHRVELDSLADLVPSAPAQLVLRRIADPGVYVATQVPYLARFWAGLLGDDTSARCRVTMLTPQHENSCTPQAGGLACERPITRTNAACGPETARVVIPYDQLIVATFDPASGRYELDATLPVAFEPEGETAAHARAAYAPRRLRPGGPRTTLARQLLGGAASARRTP